MSIDSPSDSPSSSTTSGAAADGYSARLRPHFRGIWVIAATLCVAVWGGVAFYLDFDQKASLHVVADQAEIHAKLLEEHTARTIRVLDQTTLFIKSDFEHERAHFDLQRYARAGIFLDNFFNLIATADETGQTRQMIPPLPTSNIKDRAHFAIHVAEDSGNLFVSKPVLGRSSGKWSLQFTRRLNKPDGSFGGIIVCSLDPGYFTEFYKSVSLGAGSETALIGTDGIIRARRSDTSNEIGQDLRDSILFDQLKSSPTGTYQETSLVDNTRRTYAYRRLQHYPVIVAVGINERVALAEFEQHSTLMLGLCAVITLLILAATAALHRSLLAQERINAALKQNVRDAQDNAELKSEFIARISHELRTPLTGILGFSEYLKDHAKDPDDGNTANIIHQSGKHLLALVNTTLDLAKIEAGQMTLDEESVNLLELLENAIALHSATATNTGLDLHLDLDPNLPKFIFTDRTKLMQVLINLLSNAIKFTSYGFVHLRVLVLPADHKIQFSVSDSGIGIPQQQQHCVFDRFRQLDNFITRRQGGSGLGLALAKDIVDFMRGEIWFESKPELGSTFFFTLPLKHGGFSE
jgi:signal transduction histidine kinase